MEAVVDANVLLRYLTGEPAALAKRAQRILEEAEARGVRLVVTSLTLAEVEFVLEHVYRWSRRTIVEGLLKLLAAGVFQVPEATMLERAVNWYRDMRRLHFADAYVAAIAASRHAAVISFDRELARLRGLTVIAEPDAFSR
jgi:predicted nucleic-acid-binding protein